MMMDDDPVSAITGSISSETENIYSGPLDIIITLFSCCVTIVVLEVTLYLGHYK